MNVAKGDSGEVRGVLSVFGEGFLSIATSGAGASAPRTRAVFFIVQANREQLGAIARLIDEGQIRVHVGHTCPLSEAVQAQELSEKGHGRGRIVLHMA